MDVRADVRGRRNLRVVPPTDDDVRFLPSMILSMQSIDDAPERAGCRRGRAQKCVYSVKFRLWSTIDVPSGALRFQNTYSARSDR